MKLLVGRSGTGKTTYCMNEIKKLVEAGFEKPLIYIVPEQFSFEAEKELIETLGGKGILHVQVFSFKRLAYKIFTENRVKVNPLGNSGKTMLIYFIMLKLDKELEVLKNVSSNIGLVSTVVKQISEFKRYKITPQMLWDIPIENEYLKKKIHDLALIYQEYEKRISQAYVDTNDELTLLAEVLKKDTYLQGAKIWLDEFDGFTPQEFEVIRSLNEKADLTVAMIADTDDFFMLNLKNIEKLKNICCPQTDSFKINSSNFDTYFEKQDESKKWQEVKLEKNWRFQNAELRHLEKNMYQLPFKPYPEEIAHIHLAMYHNLNAEVDALAQNILELVRGSKNIRFENIAVLTRDIDKYKNLFKMIFPLYEIPFFFDDKKELSMQPLIALLMAFFDICTTGYSYESVFAYLRTGLTNLQEEEDIDRLENYVLKWGIRGKPWESDFVFEDENLERINEIRKQVVEPISRFKREGGHRKTVREMVTGVFTFLEEIGVYATLQKKVETFKNSKQASLIAIAGEYTQVWNILMGILDEMVATIGEERCGIERFKNILKMGVSNHEIGIIPPTKDKVTIGDIERTRNNAIKVLYIVGVNDGAFPHAFQNEGFINDHERGILLEQGIEIAKDTKIQLIEENFNIYKALCVPSEELYISYPVSDLEGKSLRPSFLIHQIQKMFPSIKIDSYITQDKEGVYAKKATFSTLLTHVRHYADTGMFKEEWKDVYKWYQQEEPEQLNRVLKGLYFKNTVEYQSEVETKRLYGKEMNASVSKLEKYVLCPYSFYLKYGLKAKEREVYKLNTPDIGSFLHAIIEKFTKRVLEEEIDLKTLEQSTCNQMVEEIVQEELVQFKNDLFHSSGKLRKLSIKLKQLVMKMVWLITLQMQAGDFTILGSEVEFGQNKSLPAMDIALDHGCTLKLNGKIDRVDIAKTSEGNFIRIVDYKSSSKEVNLANVYQGVQLQLLTYMDVMAGNEFLPGGVFYLKLADPILRTSKNISKEEAEEQIRKTLRMNGLVLADATLVEAMDHKMAEASSESEVIHLKTKKDGTYTSMPTVSKEQFEDLRYHIRKTLAMIGNEILSGNIKNEPLKRKGTTTPCEYCEYRLICQFDKHLGNQYRYGSDEKAEEILDKIKKERLQDRKEEISKK